MRIKKREKVNQPTTPSSAAVPSSSSFQSRLHLLHTTFVPFHHFQPRRPLREFALGPFARVFPVPWELCPGSSLKFALISTSFVASATSSATSPLYLTLFDFFLRRSMASSPCCDFIMSWQEVRINSDVVSLSAPLPTQTSFNMFCLPIRIPIYTSLRVAIYVLSSFIVY